MTSDAPRRGLLLLCLVLALAPTAAAGYTGSSLGVTGSGSVTGNVLLEYGSSHYSGEVSPGGTYDVTFPVSIPPGASIRTAAVYLFWSWSHDGDEGVQPSLRTQVGGATRSPIRSYSDRKGTPPYDYPSGLLVYSAAGQVTPGRPLTVTVTNSASSAGVAFSGAVLLLAYDGGSTGARYWVAEGADMLYATGTVTADAATTRITFTNVPAVAAGTTADLLSVVPGGNKGQNRLDFNDHAFPGLFAGRPYADLAVVSTPVGSYLRAGSNAVALRDEGDYMVPGLFVLRVAGTGSASPTTTPTTTGTTTATATGSPPRTTTLPGQTTTMATTLQTTQTPRTGATTATGLTFTPGVTILPSQTATTSAPVTNQTTAPGENATSPAATYAYDAVLIAPAPGANGTVNTTMATITVPTNTTLATTEPTTLGTTVTTTEPTTEATTAATTEPTIIVTTTVSTTAATMVAPVIMGAPPAPPGPQPSPTSGTNASSVVEGDVLPPSSADAAAGDDLLVSVLSGDGVLPGLGVVIFGLLAGAGIIVSSALVGAGIASYLIRSGERHGEGAESRRRDRRADGQTTDRAGRPWRYGDDR